jgi:glycine/D-amino acid oxidase-like deaminating enzyme/nitrite reductase/ring-hydroxylating ferredoxin subunit
MEASSRARQDDYAHGRTSFWMASAADTSYAALTGEAETDVVVIGGGIVGLTTSLLLLEAGLGVILLEAARVAAGVSGYTSAKVTAAHGLLYSHLEAAFGVETARSYAASQTAALTLIRRLCAEHGIACDLERQANYVYAESEREMVSIRAEVSAARRAGLEVAEVGGASLPVPAAGGLVVQDQAQFHVRNYLLGIAKAVADRGGTIAECSRAVEIEADGPYRISTEHGLVRAPAVVVASHYPIVEQGFFATRIHPRRSYVVAAPLEGTGFDGMFINAASPTRSLRSAPLADGRRLLLVGGEGHRVGQEPDTQERYAVLERFMREHFTVGETLYTWSTQDNHSVDRLPFVGRVPETSGMYVASGFAGWGMTMGSAAAMHIADAIRGNANPSAGIYALQRRHLRASAKTFLRENTNVARQQLGQHDTAASIAEIPPGGGAIISSGDEHYAVSRDATGRVRAIAAACTHMGCTVAWNEAEATWDCPCHGSRFSSVDGGVLHGPALRSLELVELDDIPTPSDA